MAIRKSFNDNAVLIGTSSGDKLINAYGDHATLDGGAGNDLYIIKRGFVNNDAHTTVIEGAGGGTDTVEYHGAVFDFTYGFHGNFDGFSLPDNVENLTLVGGAQYGSGNALANVIDASRSYGGDFYGQLFLYGGAGNDTIISSTWYGGNLDGGAGNDSLLGQHGDDDLYGGAGSDTLQGGYGNDYLTGSAGNDSLMGGDQVAFAWTGSSGGYGGSDTIYGGGGNDVISGGNDSISSASYGSRLYAGSDSLYGDDGNDSISGGNDVLNAGAAYADAMYGGADTLSGGDGNDTLNGGDDSFTGGNDPVHGVENIYGSNDRYFGGAGNDSISVGDTIIKANGGNDEILAGYPSVFGDSGNDTLIGGLKSIDAGDGDDIVYGNQTQYGATYGYPAFFSGGSGNDSISGGVLTVAAGNGNDTVYGGMMVYYGDDGNDQIKGVTATIDGGAGRDVLYGVNEFFSGNDGNDSITAAVQVINGGAGDDTVFGGYSSFYGGEGNDTMVAANVNIDGGPGDDNVVEAYVSMFGGYGNDSMVAAKGNDFLQGGSGNDNLSGLGGNDFLAGNDGNDTLQGGDGDDTLFGGYGDDSLAGGAGNDVYYAASYAGTDTITDSGGDDTVWIWNQGGSGGSFTAGAGIENIIDHSFSYGIYGADQVITGNASDNFIYAGSGNDTVIGGTGNDALDGGYGADRLLGGGGNDYFIVQDEGDVVVENAGEGIDTMFVNTFGNGHAVTAANVENLTLGYGAGYATIFGNVLANVLTANAFDNTVYGGVGNDTIITGGGADALFGGKGDDLYIVEGSDDAVMELGGQGTDTVRSNGSFTLGQNVEHLEITASYGVEASGNALNNRITGNVGDDTIDGASGNDTMIGGAGDDSFYVDALGDVITEAAGGGFDTAWVLTPALAGGFTMAAELEVAYLGGGANLNLFGNALSNGMYGNSGNNFIDGGAGNDIIYGFQGSDTLVGGAGNDMLDGGIGNDSMSGGDGNDVYFVNRGDGAGAIAPVVVGGVLTGEDVVSDSGGTNDTVISTVYTYTLGTGIENLFLEGQARHGTGNELSNFIYGNGFNNKLDGAAGNDTISGDSGNDSLTGGAGNDLLIDGSGADTLRGGLGNDVYVLKDGANLVIEDSIAGSGTDTVIFYGGGFYGANIENLVLEGSAQGGYGNNLNNLITATNSHGGLGVYLFGNAGNDTLLGSMYGGIAGFNALYGGAGNDSIRGGDATLYGVNNTLYGDAGNDTLVGSSNSDVLQGGGGTDMMTGGAGSDTYFITTAADVVIEAAGAAAGMYDTIILKSDTKLTVTMAANVEQAFVSGAYGFNEGHTIIGNSLNNNIGGDAGHNSLNGGAGDDTVSGFYGKDTMVGDAGNDALYGGSGNDSIDGGAGSDALYGQSGNDTLVGGTENDALIGGSGNDSMIGGAGDDDYQVDSGIGGAVAAGQDNVVELAGGGIDTVHAVRGPVSIYTLSSEVENLHVMYGSPYGGASFSGTGNNLANVFNVDNLAYGDHFDGLGGTDTLNGELNAFYADGYVALSNIENVNLHLDMQYGSSWAINGGGDGVTGQKIMVSGSMYGNMYGGYPSLSINELDGNDRVSFQHLDAYAGSVSVSLANSSGLADSLNISLLGDTGVVLQSNGIETLKFLVRGDDNAIDVAGVYGEDSLVFGGLGTDLSVFGLDVGQNVQASEFAVQSLGLFLNNYGFGGYDVITLGLDGAVIGDQTGGGGLFTDPGLETLIVNTHGETGAAHGGSFLDGSGVANGTVLAIYGGQDLTAIDLGNSMVYAGGLSADLDATWRSGVATTLFANSGTTIVDMGDLNDFVQFYGNFDNSDFVDGGAGSGDTVAAVLLSGTYNLNTERVENLDFELYGGGSYTFNLGGIAYGGGVDIDLSGDATSNVTFQLADPGTPYNINASFLTTGTLSASTGSANDTLVGGAAGDTFDGGGGSDMLTGSTGTDTFIFSAAPGDGVDTITDFASGNDRISLSLSQFGDIGAVGATNINGHFVSALGAPVAGDADDHVLYNQTTGQLYYDADGNGGEAAVQIASLGGGTPLASTDFNVIS